MMLQVCSSIYFQLDKIQKLKIESLRETNKKIKVTNAIFRLTIFRFSLMRLKNH